MLHPMSYETTIRTSFHDTVGFSCTTDFSNSTERYKSGEDVDVWRSIGVSFIDWRWTMKLDRKFSGLDQIRNIIHYQLFIFECLLFAENSRKTIIN